MRGLVWFLGGLWALLSVTLGSAALAEPAEKIFPDFAKLPEKQRMFLAGLDFKRGKVDLKPAPATLDTGTGFYYLDKADTTKVLVDAWRNPPGTADDTLGMLFPISATPLAREAWGSVITYDAGGYVSDEDAGSIDFDALLASMKEETAEASKRRVAAGNGSVELVGWASPPFYDRGSHKLHWARELIFGGSEAHTLNYAVRALGREGVVQLNFVAPLTALPTIKAAIPGVLAAIDFQPQHRYADVQPSDPRAAYGIAGLIGGVAAAKLATKAGLFVVALAFLKKGWILVVLAAGVAVRFAGRLFGRKPPAA